MQTDRGQQRLIGEVLMRIISCEKVLERKKQNLALKSDFNLLDVFKTFNPSSSDRVSLNELYTSCVSLGVHFSQKGLQVLMQKYDYDADGYLR